MRTHRFFTATCIVLLVASTSVHAGDLDGALVLMGPIEDLTSDVMYCADPAAHWADADIFVVADSTEGASRNPVSVFEGLTTGGIRAQFSNNLEGTFRATFVSGPGVSRTFNNVATTQSACGVYLGSADVGESYTISAHFSAILLTVSHSQGASTSWTVGWSAGVGWDFKTPSKVLNLGLEGSRTDARWEEWTVSWTIFNDDYRSDFTMGPLLLSPLSCPLMVAPGAEIPRVNPGDVNPGEILNEVRKSFDAVNEVLERIVETRPC